MLVTTQLDCSKVHGSKKKKLQFAWTLKQTMNYSENEKNKHRKYSTLYILILTIFFPNENCTQSISWERNDCFLGITVLGICK